MQKVHPKPTSFGLDGFLWGPDASRVKADATSDMTILSTCTVVVQVVCPGESYMISSFTHQ